MFDVIVPTYKPPISLLKKCLESIRNQTFQDYTVWICDGTPEDWMRYDAMQKVFQEYPEFNYEKQTGEGVSQARNQIIEKGSNPYVAFLDEDDYPQGSPVGKRKLVEVRVDTWDGFIFYTMSDDAPDLMDYLDPIPEIYKNHNFKDQIRAQWVRVELDVNWKFFCDNFNESYHTRFVHPQVPSVIDQDHFTSRYEMFPKGHARIIQMGRPSLRDRVNEDEDHPFKMILESWGVDVNQYPDYETLSQQGWTDLKKAKRKLYKEKGYHHYENLSDEELTESPFQFIFPNIAMGVQADGCILLNWFPHPTDPEKCFFDLWDMGYPIGGSAKGIGKTGRESDNEFTSTSAGIGKRDEDDVQEFVSRTKVNPVKLQEVELDHRDYDGGKGVEDLWDHVVYQDWQLTDGLRRGVRSKCYQEPYLAAQETRVRYFHETLHDYLHGKETRTNKHI